MDNRRKTGLLDEYQLIPYSQEEMHPRHKIRSCLRSSVKDIHDCVLHRLCDQSRRIIYMSDWCGHSPTTDATICIPTTGPVFPCQPTPKRVSSKQTAIYLPPTRTASAVLRSTTNFRGQYSTPVVVIESNLIGFSSTQGNLQALA